MGRYKVFIKRSAARELNAIASKIDRQRITTRIQALATAPRAPGCEKLAGHDRRYRVRKGDYRVVYEIDDAERSVTIFKIGHRREVYR